MKYIICALSIPFVLLADLKEETWSLFVNVGKMLYRESDLYPLEARRWVQGDVFKVGMTVEGYQESDIESSRKIVVHAAEKFLSAMNQSKNLRPYLVTYPFTSAYIDFELRLKKISYDDVSPGTISRVVLDRGILKYFIPMGPFDRLVHEETFAQAKMLLID